MQFIDLMIYVSFEMVTEIVLSFFHKAEAVSHSQAASSVVSSRIGIYKVKLFMA